MTLKIETRRSGDSLIVQLIGEFDVGHLDEVKAQVNDAPCAVVVDIGELTEKVFREDLKINPNNPRSLFGLAETQRKQKKSWTATMTAFKTNWRGGTLRVEDL